MARRPETGDRATVLLVHSDPTLRSAARRAMQRLLERHGGNLSAARIELSRADPDRPLGDNRALLAAVDSLELRRWLVEHSPDGRTGRPKKLIEALDSIGARTHNSLMSTTRYDEMRLARCPGCGDPLDSRHWDDLSEEFPSEEYHCDCGVSFEVSRADELAVQVRRVD